MSLSFYSLSSGSSGNCYYLGNGTKGILVDAGISAGSIRKFLRNIDVSMSNIMGILITHNHIDHIKGLDVLTGRYAIPVFTTGRIRDSIFSPGKKLTHNSFCEISPEKIFHLSGFDIVGFTVSHDAPETIGFHISAGEKKITIVTDLGHICTTAARYIRKANLLVIESNYDERMLTEGRYPHFLKSRIRSDHGHLGNHQTAKFLSENFNNKMDHICLAHLSKNNNTPEIALQTLQKTLSEKGIILNENQRISVLNRNILTKILSPNETREPLQSVIEFS